MNYEKAYAELIENRKNRKLDPNEYYELHHIWPRGLAVDKEEEKLLNQDWNLIDLIAREHFVAHWLLFKMTEGENKVKMAHAFWCMCRSNENQQRKITSKQYEIARKAFSEAMKGENNSFYGKNHTEESRNKMSESTKGENHPLYGKNRSEEAKQKMSEAQKGENNPNYGKSGKSLSEETRKKISETKSGKSPSEESKQKISESMKKPQTKVECPHCGKIGGKTNMKRYHFDNCKYKK